MARLRDLFGFVLAPLALVGVALALDLPLPLPVEPYQDGVTPLYRDRAYTNEAPSAALGGHRVVRVPRHLRFPIELELSAPMRVVRLLSDVNDNAPFSDWEPEEALAVHVPGRSCVLTRAVARTLGAGTHRLPPGGPIAAAPLLVAGDAALSARTTAGWNKLVPGAGPLELATRNPRKLLALATFWVGWCWVFWRWRARRR